MEKLHLESCTMDHELFLLFLSSILYIKKFNRYSKCVFSSIISPEPHTDFKYAYQY